jgi:hypothetical protein
MSAKRLTTPIRMTNLNAEDFEISDLIILLPEAACDGQTLALLGLKLIPKPHEKTRRQFYRSSFIQDRHAIF